MYGFSAELPNLYGVGVEGEALLGSNLDIEQPSEEDASEERY
jgi:hypothetical protein